MSIECECHKINWDFVSGVHTYKDNGDIVNNSDSKCCDCQTKVSRGEWTMEQYYKRCKYQII